MSCSERLTTVFIVISSSADVAVIRGAPLKEDAHIEVVADNIKVPDTFLVLHYQQRDYQQTIAASRTHLKQ